MVALSAFLQIFDPNFLLLLLHVLYFSWFYITYISITDTKSILYLFPLLYIIYELQVYLIVIRTMIVDECL